MGRNRKRRRRHRFYVSDLDECPEDAVLGRALFCADDYVSVLEKRHGTC